MSYRKILVTGSSQQGISSLSEDIAYTLSQMAEPSLEEVILQTPFHQIIVGTGSCHTLVTLNRLSVQLFQGSQICDLEVDFICEPSLKIEQENPACQGCRNTYASALSPKNQSPAKSYASIAFLKSPKSSSHNSAKFC